VAVPLWRVSYVVMVVRALARAVVSGAYAV